VTKPFGPSKLELREDWLTDRHALFDGANEFMRLLSTFIDRFG
jgi:hypothetical protein